MKRVLFAVFIIVLASGNANAEQRAYACMSEAAQGFLESKGSKGYKTGAFVPAATFPMR